MDNQINMICRLGRCYESTFLINIPKKSFSKFCENPKIQITRTLMCYNQSDRKLLANCFDTTEPIEDVFKKVLCKQDA